MKTILALALALVAFSTSAQEEPEHWYTPDWSWSRTDTAFEVVTAGLILADWSQTTNIARTCVDHSNCYEKNPVLGPHPSLARVNILIPAALVGHVVVARLLPNPYRRVFQMVTIYGEVDAVHGNYVGGVKFGLPW